MKFSLSWLKRHLDTDAPPAYISQRLTDIGLEIEAMHDPASLYAAFSVAHVVKARQHPNADRLQICTVHWSGGEQEVVCGAPNARAGMGVIFAPEGSVIPSSGDVLKKVKIRGVESRGMLVSMAEMGLSEEAQGIIEISKDVAIGTPMVDAMDLNDPVFDIALTPNRGDCAGVYGVARDLAAAGVGKLKSLDSGALDLKGEVEIKVEIKDSAACPMFCVRKITGLNKGAKSPKWLQDCLRSAGISPICAIVDVTNFFAIDRARPMHAYDFDKLAGDTLCVRKAQKGEKLKALDDCTYELKGNEILICDAEKPQALGGIIGGIESACDDRTSSIVLEAALFDPCFIAKAGRAHGIESASRYRFERGVDTKSVQSDLDAASAMIIEICGGAAVPMTAAGNAPKHSDAVTFCAKYINDLTGLNVDEQRQVEILLSLGFAIDGDKARPPSWRHDVSCKADLAEEIARIVGYDAIPSNQLDLTPPMVWQKTRSDKALLEMVSRGFLECVTPSFMGADLVKDFGGRDAILIENPISEDLSALRPSPLPNLIDACVQSARNGNRDAMLCEVGAVFFGDAPCDQENVAAMVRSGDVVPRNPHEDARQADVFDAKADALAVFASCGVLEKALQIDTSDLPPCFHPGRAGALRQGKNILGFFGEIHPSVAKKCGVKWPIAMASVFLDRIPASRAKSTKKQLILPELQAIKRDFAFVVDGDVKAARLSGAIAKADQKLIDNVEIFDVYEGLEGGKKSIAICVTIQPRGKDALTDDDISALSDKIIAGAEKSCGAKLRV